MTTLQDVAKQYRKSAAQALYPGLPYSGYKTGSSRAFKTGNLLTKFLTSPNNDIKRIGSKIKNGYQLVVDIAPTGADYGRWVHNGTRRMNKRPWAELGLEEPKFQKVLDEFLMSEVEKIVDGELEVLDNEFKKAGFKIS
jgi:hypothetical protein